MLTAEVINTIPEGLELMAWSKKEVDENSTPKGRAYLARNSERIWVVRNAAGDDLLIAGIYRPALIGHIPELYLLVCEAFKRNLRHNLVGTRELVKELMRDFPHVMVQIDARYPVGQRFAEFMGFTSINRHEVHKGREYIIYEVKNGN